MSLWLPGRGSEVNAVRRVSPLRTFCRCQVTVVAWVCEGLQFSKRGTSSMSVGHAIVPDMAHAAKPDPHMPVDELDASMGGVWLVVTQGSRHEWDLDAMTYQRVPGPTSRSGRFAMDGQRMPITRVERWPRVGSTSLVFYNDPNRPFDYEHFRQSSRIESISRISPTGSGDAAPRSTTALPGDDWHAPDWDHPGYLTGSLSTAR